ncbi:MAG TPA: sugar ABC transporter substrate-binding protein [Lachnospiraceae bacterium]|nr:sugar ABC transporter substrate-binding protein [Lachnospiraceae bacterium]
MQYTELKCTEYTEQLSSKAPVPGGGGTAALTGALSASLCSMVGNLTIGKKKYADVEDEIRGLMEKTERLRRELLSLVEADAEAFEPLSKAYGLPKETEEQAEQKARVMEECLKNAAEVPFQIMRKICEVIDLVDTFRKKGSVLAVSDAGVAAALAAAALKSASLNVFINTRLMTDRQKAGEMNKACNDMLSVYIPMAERTFEKVKNKLC